MKREKREGNTMSTTTRCFVLRDRCFSDPAVDEANQTFFSFAAYNAGPARVRQLREEAACDDS